MADEPDIKSPDEPAPRQFKTGAIPTPRHKLAAAAPYQFRGNPVRPVVVPSFLEMWLNDQYGDCVTAESAAAIAMYSVMCGLPETKITDATVMAFCRKYNLLNGANLDQVLDLMNSDGFHQDNGYREGPKAVIDYSNEALLKDAINGGPVKIGIASSGLPSGAGNANGWYAWGGRGGGQQDHCTGLWNYGTADKMFGALGVPVPSNAPSGDLYHHYTWSTVGVVDHAWLMAYCGEAWVRNPTTLGVVPTPPTPPTPPAPPGPIPTGNILSLTTALAAGQYAIGANGGLSASDVADLRAASAVILRILAEQAPAQLGVNWIALLQDVLKLFSDLAKTPIDILAILSDIQKIIGDLMSAGAHLHAIQGSVYGGTQA